MKKIALCIIILLLSSCNQIDEKPLTKVTLLNGDMLSSNYVVWSGRHIHQNNKEYFYYTASGFEVAFTGREIIVELNLEDKVNDIYFSVIKDNEDPLTSEVLVLEKSASFTIDFIEYKEHTLSILKRSEPTDGVTSLASLEVNGEFIIPEIANKPHFLLIGASGISGNGAIGAPSEDRMTKNSSSLHSFGYLTAKAFNGSFEFVSNSGWGLAFGYNDKKGNINIAKAYTKVGIDAKGKLVDGEFIQKEADYIIVNIGGNDFNAVVNNLSGYEKTAKIEEFKKAVSNFIATLRSDHPSAYILWTQTANSQNGKAANEVFALLDQNDRNYIIPVVIKGVGEDGPPGANNHCSYETHLVSASILISNINTIIENRT